MRNGDQSLANLEAALRALAQRVRTDPEPQEAPLATRNEPRYVSRR